MQVSSSWNRTPATSTQTSGCCVEERRRRRRVRGHCRPAGPRRRDGPSGVFPDAAAAAAGSSCNGGVVLSSSCVSCCFGGDDPPPPPILRQSHAMEVKYDNDEPETNVRDRKYIRRGSNFPVIQWRARYNQQHPLFAGFSVVCKQAGEQPAQRRS